MIVRKFHVIDARVKRCSTGIKIALGVALASALSGGLSGASTASQKTGDSRKLDLFVTRKIGSKPAQGWSSVIVKLNGNPGSVTMTNQAKANEAQLTSLGADIYRRLPIIHSVALRIPSNKLVRLSQLRCVERVSADVSVVKYDQFTVASSGADAAYSQYGLTGKGIAVAVIDSGIRYHEDLTIPGLLGTGLLSSTRIVGSANFVQSENTTDDLCGHGTHVAGIIAGNGSASKDLLCYKTYYGVARNANLVNVRVLDSHGRSDVSTVVAGIQWVINNRAKYNIKVVNLSLGHPVGESYTTDPLCQAVEQAWKAGIVVVCAAGNDGRASLTQAEGDDNEGWGTAYGSIQVPGNDPYAITVGATKSMDGNRANDRIATYSSRGPSRLDFVLKPDIIAPGNQVIATMADDSYLDTAYSSSNQIKWSEYRLSLLGGNSNKYFRLSGTSMASPVVAAAAALMLEKYPTLSADTIKARLMMSADKWADPMGNADPCTYGAGYLNIPAALKSTVVATQYAMSPTLSQDHKGNVFINMDKSIWGARAIWGTGVSDFRAIWGTKAIWGSSLNVLEASRAIWGTNVWADRAIWGTSTSAVDLTSKAIQGEQ